MFERHMYMKKEIRKTRVKNFMKRHKKGEKKVYVLHLYKPNQPKPNQHDILDIRVCDKV